MQLAVGVGLHRTRVELGHGRRHFVRERHPGILAIQSVTDHTVRGEVALAGVDVFRGSGQRVYIKTAAYSNTTLGAIDEARLNCAGCAHLAASAIANLLPRSYAGMAHVLRRITIVEPVSVAFSHWDVEAIS